jgi:oligopeptide/dipeptide ABC transporter ATP-binding protein
MYAGQMVECAPSIEIYSNPKHPYTQGLLKSIPNIELADQKLEAISGSPPDLLNLPKGCRFWPRCKFVFDKCRRENVPLYKTGKDFLDLCRGPHVERTGQIPVPGLKLLNIAGAYWRGDEKTPDAATHLWHGMAKAGKGDRFFKFVRKTGERDYLRAPGNRGVYVLRRRKGNRAEFLLISLWDSLASVKRFAGAEYNRAVYPHPEESQYLVELGCN